MTAFLTALAPGAQIAGSRDPLGLLPVWTRIARWGGGTADAPLGITNITTVAGDLRGWTTLLVALGMARAWGSSGAVDDRHPVFLAEQLIGYARVFAGEEVSPPRATRPSEVRGVSRIRMFLRESQERHAPIAIGTDSKRGILGSQRSAGVWGQISASAEASGLVDRAERQLIHEAARLWDEVWYPKLAPHQRRWEDMLRTGTVDVRGADRAALLDLAELHAERLHPLEVDAYRRRILDGRRPEGVSEAGSEGQRQLVGMLLDGVKLDLSDRPGLGHAARLAEQAGATAASALLRRIQAAEHLLGPLERLFAFLLGRDGDTIDDLVEDLDKAWTGPALQALDATEDVLAGSADAYKSRDHLALLVQARDALADGDHERLIRTVLSLNAWIMRWRKHAAPWARIEEGRLDVDFKDEPRPLVTADRDVTLVHSYYLDPLTRLVDAWKEGIDA